MSIGNSLNSGDIVNNITNINYPEASTSMAIGNTVSDNTGIPSTLPPDLNSRIIVLNFTGSNDELLTPPVSPQNIGEENLNGYVKIELDTIFQNGFLEDSGDGGFLVLPGGDGLYNTPNAWLDMSSSSNANNVGFIFGIERETQMFFSQRVTGSRLSNANDRTNMSGGGFVDLIAGDKLYLYGSAEKDGEVWLYDCNISLVLRKEV